MPRLNPNGTLFIEEYSFHEFLKHFQDAVLEGFYLDLESNDNFPQKFGDYLTVTLVAGQYTPEPEFAIEDDGHRGSASNPIDEADALADLNGEPRPSSLETQQTETTPEVEVKKAGRPKKA